MIRIVENYYRKFYEYKDFDERIAYMLEGADEIVDFIKENYDFVSYDDYCCYFNAPEATSVNEVVQNVANSCDIQSAGIGFDSSLLGFRAYRDDVGSMEIGYYKDKGLFYLDFDGVKDELKYGKGRHY